MQAMPTPGPHWVSELAYLIYNVQALTHLKVVMYPEITGIDRIANTPIGVTENKTNSLF